jgi:hypothetical protein
MKNLNDKKQTQRARAARRRGQVTFEFAIVVMGLLMASMAIVQFGIIYFTTSTLTNVTRDAARFAAIKASDLQRDFESSGSNPDKEPQKVLASLVLERVLATAAQASIRRPEFVRTNDKGENVGFENGGVSVSPAPYEAGKPVTVTLTFDLTQRFFLPEDIFIWLKPSENPWKAYKITSTTVIE